MLLFIEGDCIVTSYNGTCIHIDCLPRQALREQAAVEVNNIYKKKKKMTVKKVKVKSTRFDCAVFLLTLSPFQYIISLNCCVVLVGSVLML